MTEFKTGLVFADVHYPFQNPATISIIGQIAEDLKPDYMIDMGDSFDATGLSRWRKKEDDMLDGFLETQAEIEGHRRDIYLPLLNACGGAETTKSLWCGGNHDELRCREALVRYPSAKKYLDLSKIYPEAKICKYHDSHKVGKLHFTHGSYHCANHSKKMVEVWGANVAYGHLHTEQTFTVVTREKGYSHKGTSIPCACDMNPVYMKNSANAWINGFAVAYFFPNGQYNLYIVEVIKGRCIFNGRVYNG